MTYRAVMGAIPCILLTACAGSSAMRVSANEIIIKTSAAPICGSSGAAKVAQKQAAIETLKAGYDRYVILGEASGNNISTTQLPGTYQTYGSANVYGNYGTYQATTTYQPGAVITTGGYQQSLGIRMFKEGDPNGSVAIPAREILGPKWAESIKSGVFTCT
jgi:hypothetical protein